VYDLRTYAPLYRIQEPEGIQEVKVSPGIVLLVLQRRGDSQPLRILSIEDGKMIKARHNPRGNRTPMRSHV
jgi:hypothetical protein